MHDPDRMTKLQSRCPRCDEVVTFTPEEVELTLDRPPAETGSYTFRCPSCDTDVQRRADTRTVALLLASGVRRAIACQPSASGDDQLSPFTHDDLLEFHLLLAESDEWFDHLLELVGLR